MNAAFVNVVQYISVRKIRIRKICAVCPVRVDIKKSGNNKAAVRIERFAFAIGRTGIVASAQCSYCAVKLDTPRLQSAGEQQRGILDKKRFIILNTDLSRCMSKFARLIQNNYLFCIICASPIFALRRSRRSACETDLRVSSSMFLSERSIVLTHTNQLSEISRSVFAFVSCITA